MLDRMLRILGLRPDLGEPVVVVSGLPRSGTSMMMNMLRAAGLEIVTDRVREADEDNPRGYFEDERVKALEQTTDRSWVREGRGKVIKVISFLLKDLPDDNRYKIIFMRRDLGEVIASQNKMLVRRGEPTDPSSDEKMVRAYEAHLRKVDLALGARPHVERIDVEYRATVSDPASQAARVAAFLGRSLDTQRMAQAVDPALYRNRG